ncbi:flagellar assembly protein FliW [Actinomadura hibisca]|uniref:flagellar assembly protein FliW n=1 Tax=Actinomadura hibisca TaxID=68565 RepID=UPI000A0278F2|nr:flagellar assembly protein FliW [Actinomadura hibisca]
MIALCEDVRTPSVEETSVQASAGTDALPTIELAAPLPGFPQHRLFALVRVDDEGLLYALKSLEDPNLRFLVIAPDPFFPDYDPEIDEDSLAALEVTGAGQLLVLLIVTASGSISEATVNLMAPIVVNFATRRAVQVVLAGSDLPVRAPLVPA